jgi:hypothetical protein
MAGSRSQATHIRLAWLHESDGATQLPGVQKGLAKVARPSHNAVTAGISVTAKVARPSHNAVTAGISVTESSRA